MHIRNSLWLLVAFLFACTPSKQTTGDDLDARTNRADMLITNGLWFDGHDFVRKAVWVQGGKLNFKGNGQPADTTIDLSGRYVIPPFAEAHNHNLESEYGLEERISAYLDNGVFYVKLLSSIKKRIDPLMHHYNKPDGIDVSMAHAPLTGRDGHPIGIRKRFLEYGFFDDMFNSLEDIESHGYVIIDSEEDLRSKWESILSFSPDFIKINLLFSEEYERRKSDTAYFARKGLNPDFVPAIVELAHKHNLRVSAHVETAHDFHVAVTSGVDEVAHLPEIDHGNAINREDALLAKKKNIVVVTTATLINKRENAPNYDQLVENISANLRLLKDVGVTLAIGSDDYNGNSVGEFEFLDSLGIFTKLELLKMWCENSATTTFPHRKIAFFKDGYEASFLVLKQNPLEDMSAIVDAIELKVKQGVILE